MGLKKKKTVKRLRMQMGGDPNAIKAQLMALYGPDWEQRAGPQALEAYRAAQTQARDVFIRKIQKEDEAQRAALLAEDKKRKADEKQQKTRRQLKIDEQNQRNREALERAEKAPTFAPMSQQIKAGLAARYGADWEQMADPRELQQYYSVSAAENQERKRQEEQLSYLSARVQLDDLQRENDSLLRDGLHPFQLMSNRQEAGQLLSYLANKQPELAQNELRKAKTTGKGMLLAGRYIFPQAAPMFNAINNGIDVMELAQDPNDDMNRAQVGSDFLSNMKSRRTKMKPVSKVGDALNAIEIFQEASQYQEGGEALEYDIDGVPDKRKRFYWNDPKVDGVLQANSNLNFVDRYLYPRKYPVLAMNPDGTERTAMDFDERKGYSTHSMMSADHLVFPTVVQFRDGNMRRLEPRDAYNYALETGEFIKFPTAAEARRFAENGYKKGMQFWRDGGSFRQAQGAVSTEGYKADSPDRFNAFNVIPSNQITMQGVPHPVMGIDNLGNQRLMLPGADYRFPGQVVLEVPMRGNPDLLTTTNPNDYTMAKSKGRAKKYQQGGGIPPFVLDRRPIRTSTVDTVVPPMSGGVLEKDTLDRKLEQQEVLSRTPAQQKAYLQRYYAAKVAAAAPGEYRRERELERREQAVQRADEIQNQYPFFSRERWSPESLYAIAQAVPERLRLFPDEVDSPYDFLANGVGQVAKGLGEAPLQAKVSKSVLPYIRAIGTPMVSSAFGQDLTSSIVNPIKGAYLSQGLNAQANNIWENVLKLNAVGAAKNNAIDLGEDLLRTDAEQQLEYQRYGGESFFPGYQYTFPGRAAGQAFRSRMQRGGSVVDYLHEAGVDASMANRRQLAGHFGIKNYRGTARQNLQLLELLQLGENPATRAPGNRAVTDRAPEEAAAPLTPANPQDVHPINGFVNLKDYGINLYKKDGTYSPEAVQFAEQVQAANPGTKIKFECNEKGCFAIANRVSEGETGKRLYGPAAWKNSGKSVWQAPALQERAADSGQPLADPQDYTVPQEIKSLPRGMYVGLNRKNNRKGNMATTAETADDSYDYANNKLYPGGHGYEHMGYSLGNGRLFHGTGADDNHPGYFVIDDMTDNDISLSGYGRYAPVEVLSPNRKAEPIPSLYAGPKTKKGEVLHYSLRGDDKDTERQRQVKQELVSYFNDPNLDKRLMQTLGISQKDLQGLKPVLMGVLGNKTGFDDLSLGRATKEAVTNLVSGSSVGPFQTDYKSIPQNVRDQFGIKKQGDLKNLDKAYPAALATIYQAFQETNKAKAKGKLPGLKNADPYFSSVYALEGNPLVGSGEEEIERQWQEAYQNPVYREGQQQGPLTEKDREAFFARRRLKMDRGSDPYRAMENAYDLSATPVSPSQLAQFIAQQNKKQPPVNPNTGKQQPVSVGMVPAPAPWPMVTAPAIRQSSVPAPFGRMQEGGEKPLYSGPVINKGDVTRYWLRRNEKDTKSQREAKQQLVNYFNDPELDQRLMQATGISPEDLQGLKPVMMGVLGNESRFNNSSLGRSTRDFMESFFYNSSIGPFQTKYGSVPQPIRDQFGIMGQDDLNDMEKAYPAALSVLYKGLQDTDKAIAEKKHPELNDKNRYFRSGYAYNMPAITKGGDERIEKLWQQAHPKNGEDPLLAKEKEAFFAKKRLRFDKGSYPYKAMENAYDLLTTTMPSVPWPMASAAAIRQSSVPSPFGRMQRGGVSPNTPLYSGPVVKKGDVARYALRENNAGDEHQRWARQQLVDYFNNPYLDRELMKTTGMSKEDLQGLKPVMMGLLGNESTYDDYSLKGHIKEFFADMFGSNSVGPFQIRYASTPEAIKKRFDIADEKELYDLNKGYPAAMAYLYKGLKLTDNAIAKGKHPGLEDKDRYFRAAYAYNMPMMTWKGDEQLEALWKKHEDTYNKGRRTGAGRNLPPLTAADKEEFFNQRRLRMDVGSYPYKAMQRASDLVTTIVPADQVEEGMVAPDYVPWMTPSAPIANRDPIPEPFGAARALPKRGGSLKQNTVAPAPSFVQWPLASAAAVNNQLVPAPFGRLQDGGETDYQPPHGYVPSTPQQRASWNQFLDYLNTKGIAGSKDLDVRDKNLGLQYLAEYNKAYPKSRVDTSFIPTVQYENYLIRKKNSFPGMTPEAAQAAFAKLPEAYRAWPVSGVDNWLGSYTSKEYYPTYRSGQAIHKADGTEQVDSYDFGVNFEDYVRSLGDPNLKQKYHVASRTALTPTTSKQIGGGVNDTGLYPYGVINPFDIDPTNQRNPFEGIGKPQGMGQPQGIAPTGDTGLYPYGVINPFDMDPYELQKKGNNGVGTQQSTMPLSGIANQYSKITIGTPNFTFNKPAGTPNTGNKTTQGTAPKKSSWGQNIDPAYAFINTLSGFNNALEANARNRDYNEIRLRNSGDAIGAWKPTSRGDWTVNGGYLKPDRNTVVQFGAIPTPMAAFGGGYYSEPTELEPIAPGPMPTLPDFSAPIDMDMNAGMAMQAPAKPRNDGPEIDVPDIKPNTRVRPNKAAWEAFDYYVNEKGLAPHVAAGIVGNLYQESGVQTDAVEKGNTGNGRGIAQWDVRDRWQGFLKWAEKNGFDKNSKIAQYEFILNEAGESDKMKKAMAKARTPEEAAHIFGKVYERPSEKYARWDIRAGIARQLFESMAGDAIAKVDRKGSPKAKLGGEWHYQQGGEYVVTPEQLQAILANGGEVEMI